MKRGLVLGFLATAVVAAAASAFGYTVQPRHAALSYLFAFAVLYIFTAGAILFLLIGHATGALWFVAVRRPAERVAAAAVLLPFLFVPVVLTLGKLYPWMHPEGLEEEARHAVLARGAWFHPGPFAIRGLLLLGATAAVGEWLFRVSRRSRARTRTIVAASSVTLPLFGLVACFAMTDWIMSLDARFYSTLFGPNLIAGGFCAATAFVIVSLAYAGLPELQESHFHALGRLLLAGVAVWGYFSFSEFLIVWIADNPAETERYLVRLSRGWQWLGLVSLVGRFVLPFFALLSRRAKERREILGLIALSILGFQVVDVYYAIAPSLGPPSFHWLDATSLAAALALAAVVMAVRTRRLAALPEDDPVLGASLAYRS